MRRRILYLALVAVLTPTASPLLAQTFTLTATGAPETATVAEGGVQAAATTTHRTAPDYATDVLGDPWDFEQTTDYVYMFSTDDTTFSAASGTLQSAWASVPTMVAGHFLGVSRATTPRVQLLFEGIDGALNVVGRNGVRFPIDTSRFRRLSFRMKRGSMPSAPVDTLQATWFTRSYRSADTVGGHMVGTQGYDNISQAYPNQSPPAQQGTADWHIYKIDLDKVHARTYGPAWTGGPVRGLRLDLGNAPSMVGTTIELDWVRLTERGSALATLSFSGFGGAVTVTARHQETGDVIQVFPDNGTNATTFADNSSFVWDYGFLPPGTWTITATRGSRSVVNTLVVDPPPVLEVLEPDERGGRDYGRTVVGDAYDLTNSQDVTRDGWLRELNNVVYGENGLTATTEGNSRVPDPDPFIYLADDSSRRPGTERLIDATTYRHLTFTLEYDRKDLSFYEALLRRYGGIARVIWRAANKNGATLTNTQDLFVLDGGPHTYSMDLATFSQFGDCSTCQLEAGYGTDLWQGPMAVLRIDPYESDTPRWFRLADIRIAADDEPTGTGFFAVRWRVGDATFAREVASSSPAGSDAVVSLYYDSDTNPATGRVLIASNLPASTGLYRWYVGGLPQGRYFVYAVVTDAAGNGQGRYSTGPVRVGSGYPDLTDTSGTGMPDEWRAQYAVTSPSADDDGDGLTNLAEFERGTNPRVSNTWNLPEGATGYFLERIALANPDPTPSDVTITYLRRSGAPVVRDYTVLGNGRLTVTANEVAGLASEEFSAVVTSTTGGVVAERTMYWGDQLYGGHTGKAVQAARTRWFFAEGDAGFFQTWILLANATSQAANVTVTYLLPGGGTIVRQYPLASNSRYTIFANAVPGLAGRSFSADISSDVPITVERAMYFSNQGRFWTGGHVAAAVPAAAKEWFVAEGRTGPFFDMYVLLANPSPTGGTARIRYLMPGGVFRDVDHALDPNSRTTVFVDGELEMLGFPDTDVSARITADVPIIVERAMYWPGNPSQWTEAHASAGVTSAGTQWVLAEGDLGGSLAFDTYVLFANPSDQDAQVRVKVLRPSGVPSTVEFTVVANSRATKQASMLGASPNEACGLLVESVNGVPIVVERAMYWNGGGQFWGGGTNETAFRLR